MASKMNTHKVFGLLVAVMAIFFAIPAIASASFGTVNDVTVNGISHYDGENAGVFAGENLAVRVTFTADESEDDVRVIAKILGEPGLSDTTEEFDVVNGSVYSRLLNIQLPNDLGDKDNLDERFVLKVTIESNSDELEPVQIFLQVQRVNDRLEILSIESENEVKAGDYVTLDVVVDNSGRDTKDNVFVRASIPALGISKTAFLNDLAPFDQGGDEPDKYDSALARVFLKIPANTPAGVYNVEVEAYNKDATTVATRKIVVLGAAADSSVISSAATKTFAAGEEQTYTLTIVNADDSIKLYELVLESANGLMVNLDESVFAVPAGSSKTVTLTAYAANEGSYSFAVNVNSDGELVKKQSYIANVEGKSSRGTGNAAVVLTIVLAIIFVVLLVVLIVLLTRKPEKTEDFGESYY